MPGHPLTSELHQDTAVTSELTRRYGRAEKNGQTGPNVLMTEDGPRVIDFGIPRASGNQNLALFCGGTGFTAARIDAASGRTLWRAGTRPQGAEPIGVRDGLVYMYEDPDDRTRRLVALDAATGHRRWQRDINKSQDAVLYDGGLLTLSPDYSSFVAYGPSGMELWRAPSLNEVCTPSALGGAPTRCVQPAPSPARPRSS